MKTNITKIKIDLDGCEIELTVEKAKKVHEQLALLFANAETAPLAIPTLVPYPYPYPIVVDPCAPWWPQPWIVTYTTGGGTVCMAT